LRSISMFSSKNTSLNHKSKSQLRRLVTVVAALVSITIASCGGGGGGGGSSSKPSTITTTPAMNGFVSPDSEIVITISNSDYAKSPGVYTIFLYDDGGGFAPLASIDALVEDGGGNVVWQTGYTAQTNRSYYWQWSGIFTTSKGTETRDSGILTMHVKKEHAMEPISPRDNGYLDVNLAATPRLAVKNLYTYPDATVSYDFELYEDAALTKKLGEQTGVAQIAEEPYTYFDLPITTAPTTPTAKWLGLEGDTPAPSEDPQPSAAPALLKNSSYFWRARAVVDGTAMDWTPVYTFTVRNFCEISGGRYAAHIIDWTHDRNCQQILRDNPNEALGGPNAAGWYGNQNSPGVGFVSIDIGGTLIVEMGTPVYNGGGYDIRIYQYVSQEPMEVFVAQSESGPWYQMGPWTYCGFLDEGETAPNGHCDFDLGATPLKYAKYIKIKDIEDASCYTTAGAEIDAVTALHSTASVGTSVCGQ